MSARPASGTRSAGRINSWSVQQDDSQWPSHGAPGLLSIISVSGRCLNWFMTSQHTDHPESGIPAVLTQIRRQVRELTDTLWAARPAAEIMDTVAEIETLKSALDALELQAVRELDATHAVKDTGWASTQDFVTAIAGGHKGTGPATVRLANAVDEPVMAPVAEALADGWLSTTKAHLIERAIDALPSDPDVRTRGVQVLLDEAKSLDATELRKVARRLADVVDPDGDQRRAERELDREERAAHLGRHLSIRDDQAGGAWIKGRCSSEDAALPKSTLIPLAKPEPAAGPVCDPDTCGIPGCGHDGRDPRDHGARMLDALVDLCRRAQSAELLPDCHGATPRVSVTIDLDDLRDTSGFGSTETGEALCASTIRRMCCDADLIPVVLGTNSEVLDVGRLQRLVTAAIWKALVARDQHCRFPHCTRPPIMTHAHHIIHWIDGGPTSMNNLILLCGHHHRLIHAGPWHIRRDGPAQFTFEPPPGVRRHTQAPPDDG